MWCDDIHDIVVDIRALMAESKEIVQALLSKFRNEVYEILFEIKNVEELIKLNRMDQERLFVNLHCGMEQGFAKVLDEFAAIKIQMDNGHFGYLQQATWRLKNAATAALMDKTDGANVSGKALLVKFFQLSCEA